MFTKRWPNIPSYWNYSQHSHGVVFQVLWKIVTKCASPECIFLCFVRWSWRMNVFPHSSHSYLLSSWCTRKWSLQRKKNKWSPLTPVTRKEKNSIKLSIMRTGLLLNHAHPSLFAPFLTSRGLPASHLTPGSHSAVFGQHFDICTDSTTSGWHSFLTWGS